MGREHSVPGNFRRNGALGSPSMGRLVALAMHQSAAMVTQMRRCWDAGDAVAPIDTRLPAAEVERLLAILSPSVVLDDSGESRTYRDGIPTEPGDALVMTTSGTTAVPKGVVLTHESVSASARATSRRLDVRPDSDHWLACLPLSHVGGMSVVTRALVTGTSLTVHPRFDVKAVGEAAAHGVTLVSLVATAWRRIDPSLFRTVVLGGMAPPERLPANVVTTYGMTETGSGVVYDGRPLDGVRVGFGEGNEILLRGPMLASRYRDGSPVVGGDGWLRTADAGTIGDDGRLVVLGRTDDVINTGGEKVWPATVETALASHPLVAEVAVVGRDHPEWGREVVACVVPADPADPPPLEQLRDMVRERMAPWCAPRALVLTGSLPRTALGKVRRSVVTELVAGQI